jgi:hypothetical protein
MPSNEDVALSMQLVIPVSPPNSAPNSTLNIAPNSATRNANPALSADRLVLFTKWTFRGYSCWLTSPGEPNTQEHGMAMQVVEGYRSRVAELG